MAAASGPKETGLQEVAQQQQQQQQTGDHEAVGVHSEVSASLLRKLKPLVPVSFDVVYFCRDVMAVLCPGSDESDQDEVQTVWPEQRS